MSDEERYPMDNIFEQPDGNIVRQELVTYRYINGIMNKQVNIRRFTGNDYIDNYESTPMPAQSDD
jgi:hypothetical protein